MNPDPVSVPQVLRPPTRIVAWGVISLGATTPSQVFLGQNSRQDRIEFTVTNQDPSLALFLTTTGGVIFGTAWPQRPVRFITSGDFALYNPNAQPVQFIVCELYPDTGNLHGGPIVLGASTAQGLIASAPAPRASAAVRRSSSAGRTAGK